MISYLSSIVNSFEYHLQHLQLGVPNQTFCVLRTLSLHAWTHQVSQGPRLMVVLRMLTSMLGEPILLLLLLQLTLLTEILPLIRIGIR